jgi:DNA replication and repair protein RecF
MTGDGEGRCWQGVGAGVIIGAMRLTQITLSNFRNYTQLDLQLPAGPILLHGANAEGKTTLLEAIYYLATSKSPHGTSDRQLLNWYANGPEHPLVVGRLTATVQPAGDVRPRKLEIRLIRELGGPNGSAFRREVLVNGVKVRLMDLLGNLNVVLFLPEDVGLVTASPSERRRYMDITLCQVNRRYCRALAQYNKVLSQRNALLKALQERRGRRPELEPWSLKLAESGAIIMHQRALLAADLDRRAGEIHFQHLTGEAESLRLVYQPQIEFNAGDSGAGLASHAGEEAAADPAGWLRGAPPATIADALSTMLEASVAQDLQRGVTLIGPHRDDLRFLVNGRDVADYGSRGQQRTAVLALKLAEVEWMENQSEERPILLLDEVLAELDQTRRAYLLERIGGAEQSLLTATDPGMFTHDFLARATRLEVAGGRVTGPTSKVLTAPDGEG